jgi:Thoeris protein ThsB, TIR-like domain
MSYKKIYKLFISHTNEDNPENSRFLNKLSASHDFQWENYGTLGKSEYHENDLYHQIKPVDVVIILSGLYSKHQKLIQKQIDIAQDLGKPIIVIRPWEMENVPGSIEKVAWEVVGWNTACIVDTILGVVDNPLEND